MEEMVNQSKFHTKSLTFYFIKCGDCMNSQINLNNTVIVGGRYFVDKNQERW